MSYANPKSMEYSDDELLDRYMGSEPEMPCFPPGLCFTLNKESLAEMGVEGIKPDEIMRFSAMGEVISIYAATDDCRIELELHELAGPDGKFHDMEMPAHICLCAAELEKMDMEADCERGDMIHLIGMARMKSRSESEFGDSACFQIEELVAEDESEEAREG